MAALRVLFLFLFLSLFHTAVAVVPGRYSPISADKVDQKYPDVPIQAQLLNLIVEKQAANISIGFEPDINARSGPDVPESHFLCDCKNKVALLYLHICGDISLKLSRHNIAYTFHSFT